MGICTGLDSCCGRIGSVNRVLVLVGVALMSLPIVWAGEAQGSDGDRLVTMGRRLHEQGRHSEAIDMFRRALDEDPGDVARHIDVARSLEAMEEYPEAVVEYRNYLEKGFDGALIAEAEERIDVLAEEMSWTMSEYRFISMPSEVLVYVKGQNEPLGETPFSFWLPFGEHELIFMADGFFPEERTITVRANEQERILVELEENLEFDWEGMGIMDPGMGHGERIPWLGVPYSSWVAFGVGLVGIGVGTYFGIDALGKAQEARDYDRMEPGASMNKELELIDQAEGAARGATVGFAVGGAAITTGLVIYLLDLAQQ